MDKFKEIRPVVLGIAKKNNKVLVSKGTYIRSLIKEG